MVDFTKHLDRNKSFPHAGNCPSCREAKRCNYCGADIAHDPGRCTNGRCTHCHQNVCTPGGANGTGHHYGDQG